MPSETEDHCSATEQYVHIIFLAFSFHY